MPGDKAKSIYTQFASKFEERSSKKKDLELCPLQEGHYFFQVPLLEVPLCLMQPLISIIIIISSSQEC